LRVADDGSFEYQPDDNFNGTDRFRYRLDNGATGNKTTASGTYTETSKNWEYRASLGQATGADYRYLSQYIGDKTRKGTAKWTPKLTRKGTYRVTATFRATGNRTKDADYYVYDASGVKSHFQVDQTKGLSGEASFGPVYEDLGTHYLEPGKGYVVLDGRFYSSKSRLNFLAEVWKEYAKADSRYATRDAFTICMESVTAFFVGPLCLFAAHQYCTRGPWRHLAALVASACQLYGDALYFATCFYENGVHTRPEPLYFWFYFVGLNSLWVFLPLGVSWHAVRETVRAQRRADESGWRVAGGGGKQK
jgi:hypothetical protein